MVIPQLQFFDKVIDDPVVRFVQVFPNRLPVVCNDRCLGYVPQLQLIKKVVYTPVVAQSLIPMAFLFCRPKRFPCCRTHGGRCPCCVGRASSTVAVGEETVLAPTVAADENLAGCRRHPSRCAEAVSHGLRTIEMHLLRNSLRAAHRLRDELKWGFFWALYTGTRPGPCPQGHGSHNQVHALAFMDKRGCQTLVRTTTTTSHTHHHHHTTTPHHTATRLNQVCDRAVFLFSHV